jgi:hypothetical protein
MCTGLSLVYLRLRLAALSCFGGYGRGRIGRPLAALGNPLFPSTDATPNESGALPFVISTGAHPEWRDLQFSFLGKQKTIQGVYGRQINVPEPGVPTILCA